MYCSNCASPISGGLKFCNRCGASLGKDQGAGPDDGLARSLIFAAVFLPIMGLGAMFGGAIALKQGADLNNDVVALFMFFSFVIIGTAEIFLLRQLSRVLGTGTGYNQRVEPAPPLFQPAPAIHELRPVRDTAEPIGSVTENTTRTLEHSLRDVSR